MKRNRYGMNPEQTRILIMLGVLNFLVICGMVWVVVSSIRSSQVQVAPAPSATAPPSATPSPAPTRTLRATSTPAPASMTAAEYEYISSYIDSMTEMGDAFNEISDMLELASMYPNLILAEDWRIAIAAQIAIVRLANDDLRELKPSERIETCHIQLLRVADNYDDCVTKIANGIDNLDGDMLKSAVDDMETATNIYLRFQKCIDGRIPKP